MAQLATGQVVIIAFVVVRKLNFPLACLSSIYFVATKLLLAQDQHIGSHIQVFAVPTTSLERDHAISVTKEDGSPLWENLEQTSVMCDNTLTYSCCLCGAGDGSGRRQSDFGDCICRPGGAHPTRTSLIKGLVLKLG